MRRFYRNLRQVQDPPARFGVPPLLLLSRSRRYSRYKIRPYLTLVLVLMILWLYRASGLRQCSTWTGDSFDYLGPDGLSILKRRLNKPLS